MNLNQIHNVYFIGIGGIGMSALARYFKAIGKNVSGYDKTQTELTRELQQLDIAIHFEDKIDLIPADYYIENTLVIITPAVPMQHSEWNYFIERDNEKSRSSRDYYQRYFLFCSCWNSWKNNNIKYSRSHFI
jgi:UDP-N-acetylmuramate--alanine ligase